MNGNNPEKIEIVVLGKLYAVLSAAEIMSVFPESDLMYTQRDWNFACQYLSKHTDKNRVCKIDLAKELDGTTVDLFKDYAVFFIFAALKNNGAISLLPPDISLRCIPYITARMTAAEIDIHKLRRLTDFAETVKTNLNRISTDGISPDEAFESIFEKLPPIENYKVMNVGTIKKDSLDFFTTLAEKAAACADPHYAEVLEEYVSVLKGE